MKFKYIENDPMDKVPAPVGKMVLTFLGCILYMGVYLLIWCSLLGFRF